MIVQRQAEAQRGAAGAGLVSVPSTPTGALLEAVLRGESADLRKKLDCFVIDPKAAMLPKLRRAVGFAARAHAVSQKGMRSDRAWMITLTYCGVDDWRPEHMTRCMDAARIWAKRNGFTWRYVWVAELQQRGAIHYHIVAWIPLGIRPPQFDSRGWWPHGMTNRKAVKSSATGYLMSYLKKGSHDGEFPRGSRRYGIGGLDHSLRRARRWLGLPAFVQGNSSIYDDWRRAEGGGWTAPSGEHLPSEFRRVFVGDQWALQRVHAHRTTIDAAGPFCWLSDREIAVTVH